MHGDTIRLLRIGGIPIRIHASWILIALLVVWSLATSYFPSSAPHQSTAAYWLAGLVAALLFFASLLLHELAHSLVARARGLRVTGITLYLFGGVAEIGAETTNPGDEFRVTAAGPVTSVALAGLFGIAWLATDSLSHLIGATFGYLAIMNLFLGVFNLLPGLPLDGGRLLRAFVWWRTGDPDRATRVAAIGGVVVGVLLIAAGAVSMVVSSWLSGLWLILLGWYLQGAARQERMASGARSRIAGVTVANLATRDPYKVPPDMPLDRVVDEATRLQQARAIPVVADGRFLGLLTSHSITRIPRSSWPITLASAAMIAPAEVATATPEQPIEAALADMLRRNVNQLVVVEDGRFAGMIDRNAITRLLEAPAPAPARP